MKTSFFKLLILCCFSCITLQANTVKVVIHQSVIPVLTLKDVNSVLRLELIKSSKGIDEVKEIVCSLNGTTESADIESICLYAATPTGLLSADKPLTPAQKSAC